MAIKATLVIVALALLVAFASARPIAFVGGSFTQARGHYSPNFAVYTETADNAARNGWARLESTAVDFDGPILDMYPVGEGVFAVGYFENIGPNKPSSGVAFYDGQKWCAIRESLAVTTKKRGGPTSGPSAVWCDSDASCWVAGDFSFVNNVPDEVNTEFANFAHYTYDEVTNEWQFDPAVRAWNNNSASGFIEPLGAAVVPGTLFGLTNRTDNETYFFAGVDSGSGYMTVYRGSPGDNGWRQITDNNVDLTAVNDVRDFGFDESVYPPIWYSVNDNNDPSDEHSTPWIRENLLAPCAHTECDVYVIQDAFVNFAFVPEQQTTNFVQSYESIWARNGTRYLIAFYDPDGTADARSGRYIVMKQVNDADPQPLGEPFTESTSQEIYRVRGHPLNSDWAYVVGEIEGANLFFPPGDVENGVVTDVSTDRRSLDVVYYVAEWRDLGRWEQAFGGGFSAFSGGAPNYLSFPIVYNLNSEQWFVANQGIEYVYDIVANGAAWYDNEEDPAQPSLFPIFTRSIQRRPNQFESGVSAGNELGVVPAEVFDFVCFSNCEYAYVAGDFNFHGNETLGGIALVEVEREGSSEDKVWAVGGGLWYNDLNVVRDKPDLQYTAGSVYALARQDDYLYAGGFFSRGKTGYVCLSNVARIRNSASTEDETEWEDLHGGCNDEVYDLHFWEGRLYAAGAFEYCGSRKVNYVADYTYQSGSNAQWNNLNNGVDGVAYSIEAFGGRLIFAGEFTYAGGIPASGVAAWNTAQWRPLLPACTEDCVPGGLSYYFNVLNSPSKVYNLKAAKDGNFLYARATFAGSSSGSGSGAGPEATYLARWEYFDDQDLGIWTVKGPQAEFSLDDNHKKADGVLVNNGTLIVVGGTVADDGLTHANQDLHTWDDHSKGQNWLGTHLVVAPEIFVLRSSASSLSSPLAFLLSAF